MVYHYWLNIKCGISAQILGILGEKYQVMGISSDICIYLLSLFFIKVNVFPFQETYGFTFDHSAMQFAEVTSWDTTPCIIHPASCGSGASVLLWVKVHANCPSWGGILGSQGDSGIPQSDTEGLVLASSGGGNGGLK